MGYLANSRVVVLRGTTTVSQLFSPNFFDVAGWLRTGLENRGLDVINARISGAEWFGYESNIELELNVFNNFTSEEARQNAIAAIEDITVNYGLNKVFSNTTLSIVSDAYVPPGTGGYVNPPSNYDLNPGGSGQVNNSSGTGSNWLDGLLTGSGATVLIGGVVVALILLKK